MAYKWYVQSPVATDVTIEFNTAKEAYNYARAVSRLYQRAIEVERSPAYSTKHVVLEI